MTDLIHHDSPSGGAWPVPDPSAAANNDGASLEIAVIARLASGFSVEISPKEAIGSAALKDWLPRGTEIYLPFVAKCDYQLVVDAARRLTASGFKPVPHFAARNIPSRAWLHDTIAELTEMAGVDRALIIGGDSDPALGPFKQSLDLLETGLFDRFGIDRIGLAAHPEGHVCLSADVLAATLQAKNRYAEAYPASFFLVTQFCFSAPTVIAWEWAARAAGNRLPVRLGLPGCTSLAKLIKYSRLCGIGASATLLRKQAGRVLSLAQHTSPAPLVREIAWASQQDAEALFDGLHFFTFAATERTAAWLQAVAAGAIELTPDAGFREIV